MRIDLPAGVRRLLTILVVCVMSALGLTGVGLLAAKMPASFIPAPGPNEQCRGLWSDDFMQDYVAARAWRDGLGMYTPTGQLASRYLGPGANCYQFTADLQDPHPPAFILLVEPISLLPYHPARIVWLLMSALMLAGALSMVGWRLGLPRWFAVGLGVGALALPVTQRSLSFGQSNELLLVLLTLSWLSLRSERNRSAGLALGIAAVLRIFPGLLVIPLLRERRYRAVGWFLGTAGSLSLLSAALVGGSSVNTFGAAASHNFHFWVAQPMNVSLVGTVSRWLTRSIWFRPAFNAPVVAVVSGVLISVIALVATARTPARMSNDLFLATIPWMILISPLAWPHYAIACLIGFMVVVVKAYQRQDLPSSLCMLGWAAIIISGLPGLSTEIGRISVVTQMLGYGVPFYGLLLLTYSEWRGVWRAPAAIGSPAQGNQELREIVVV